MECGKAYLLLLLVNAGGDFIVCPLLPKEFLVVHWITLDIHRGRDWEIRCERESTCGGAGRYRRIGHFGGRLACDLCRGTTTFVPKEAVS